MSEPGRETVKKRRGRGARGGQRHRAAAERARERAKDAEEREEFELEPGEGDPQAVQDEPVGAPDTSEVDSGLPSTEWETEIAETRQPVEQLAPMLGQRVSEEKSASGVQAPPMPFPPTLKLNEVLSFPDEPGEPTPSHDSVPNNEAAECAIPTDLSSLPAPPGLSPRCKAQVSAPASPVRPKPSAEQHLLASPQLLASPTLGLERRQHRKYGTPTRSWTADEKDSCAHLIASPAVKPFVIFEEDGEEFTFTHRRNDTGTGWGIVFQPSDGLGLAVKSVSEDGAMASWNRQCVAFAPMKALMAGDAIKKVNEKTDNDDMIEEFRSKLLLKVTVSRQPNSNIQTSAE